MSTGLNVQDHLPTKRDLLASRLREAELRARQVPLSFAQQRLWFLDQMEPDSPLYHIATAARLTGRLDLAALEHALNAVVARHEALRTRFLSEEGIPFQVIDAPEPIELRLIDLSSLPPAQRQTEANRLLREEVNRPFRLSAGKLIRATLLRQEAEQHDLILMLHHIVADEWSLKVLFRELGAFYRAFLRRERESLPELPIQYADYALWQREWLRGDLLEGHLSYWKTRLQGSPEATALLTDHPRTAVPTYAGANSTRRLGQDLSTEVASFAQSHDTTPFTVLLAVFKVLLHRYTRQEDLVVGSPVAGRNRVELEDLIGFFVNTLPLRTNLAGDPTFTELLARVQESAVGAFAHQDLPFEKLVEGLQPERSLSQMPFTNLMFVFQSDPLEDLSWPGLQLNVMEVPGGTAKFDLTLVLKMTRGGLEAGVEYNRDLFERATVERLLGHYETILRGALQQPHRHLSELPLLSEAERRQLLFDWNDTRTDYPRDLGVHQVFEGHARRAADAPAVMYGHQVLSYGDLNTKANQLAHFLKRFVLGTRPVAVFLERSPEMVVALLAVLKAGAAYVPLDPHYPGERLKFMLRDSASAVVVTHSQLLAALPDLSVPAVCLDRDQASIARESGENLSARADGGLLAYIMYTSGSTGEPKGASVPHRAINRLVLNTNYIQLNPGDRIGQVANLCFDAATFEVWGALLNGALLVGIPQDVLLSPSRFAQEVKRQGVTAMFLTSALFNEIAAEQPGAFETLRTLVVGGEALDPKWVRAVLRDRPPQRLLDGYGPTENTTFTCCHHIRQLAPESVHVPIGRPIANTEVYILDPHLQPVPIGVPGELFTGGDGLAHGYWDRPELTAEKFIPHPFAPPGPPKYLYRTGDLARFLPGGEIEFLGRLDDQVKVRGYRIELGEIESVLARHPEVSQCVVLAKTSSTGDKKLVAYLTTRSRQTLTVDELRSFLADSLPEYMLPAAFVFLPSLPLTSNGKIDRRALPEPDQSRPELQKKYASPRDNVERELTRIWESVLDVRPIGIGDRFFQLGGHSLLAVRVVALIEKAFGKKLRLATLFQAPTIEQLAAFLREPLAEAKPARTSLVEIQVGGTRPPLFLVHGAGGGMFWGYINLARQLGADQPVYGFKAQGLDGHQALEKIEDMARAYIEDLRALQPNGPYYLGGYCFGGNVAYEMARQLTAEGQEVAFLALFNCAPPNSRYLQVPWTPAWGVRFALNLVYLATYFGQWTAAQRREFFRWKWALMKRRLKGPSPSSANPDTRVEIGGLVDLSMFDEEERRIWEAHLRALVNYRPQPYSGQVHLFRSPGHPLWCSFDPEYGWGDFARGGVRVTVVPGAHEKILQEPCVETLARELQSALQSVQHSNPLPPDPAPVHNARPLAGAPKPGLTKPGVSSDSPQHASPISLLAGPQMPLPEDSTYPQQFVQIATRMPSATAVRFEGQELTYAELNTRANRLAHYLQGLGAGPEVLVGICLERSVEVTIALLAVLKAGAAYLPLDPNYPRARLEYMMSDSRAPLLLTQKSLGSRFTTGAARVIVLDEPEQQACINQCPDTNPGNRVTGGNLAYVIYTSGSTGRPKGVEITHRSLLNHNLAVAQAYGLQPVDRVLQFTPLSFDISVEEIFPTWLSGSTLVLRSEEVISSVKVFLETLATEQITVLNLPTAYWHELVEVLDTEGCALPPSVRLVVIGGEKASDTAWQIWKQRMPGSVALVNGYGATEATVTTTLYPAESGADRLWIGRPIANTQVVILDEQMRPVPPQTAGELHIGGAGLARGYLNRPELTAEKFMKNPFPNQIHSPRLYKTGDVARVNAAGDLEFLGRLDEQVKVRGFRIELGEVEAVLRAHSAVQDAVVVARGDARGRNRLVAYFVPRTDPYPRVGDLSDFLRTKLPGYMVPAVFLPVNVLPLTPAGKVDRKALPVPGNARPELGQEFVAARLPLEEVMAAIWAEVLDIKPIGVHDRFFDLGGDSLLALQVISRIRERLQVELSLGRFFSCPTVAESAQCLSEGGAQRAPQLPLSLFEGALSVPLSAKRRRIWLLEQFHPQRSPYNRPIGLRLEGPLNLSALRQSLAELALRHEALRAVFPSNGGEPAQFICEPREIVLPLTDFSAVPSADRERQALSWAAEEGRRPHIGFHPLLRPVLLRLSEQDHWLVMVLHEIAVDARSERVMVDDLIRFYQSFVSLEPVKLAPLRARYAEAALLEEQFSPIEEQEHIDYWVRQLKDAPALLELPADHPRPARTTGTGARQPVFLPASLVADLEGLGRAEGCDLFTTLLAGYAALLHRHSRAEDLVVGSLAAERLEEQVEQTVANFERPMVLRCDLAGDPTFRDLLRRLKGTTSAALAHSALPFAKLVDFLHPERHGSFARVFQVMLVLNNEPLGVATGGELKFLPFEIDNETAKLDLSLHLARVPNGLSGWFEYSTPLFDGSRIERMTEHLSVLLASAVASPSSRLSQLRLLGEAEHNQVVLEWNQTAKEYPASKTLVDLFLEQAARTPEAEALVAGVERLTYRELQSRAQHLANHLRRLGLQPEGLVGICLDRSSEMVVGLLATLLAGGAYVALDPAYPQERLVSIVQSAQLRILLTRGRLRDLIPLPGLEVVDLDHLPADNAPASSGGSPPLPASLAYVIYTSGSTGQPKGVALEHRNAVALIAWAGELFSQEELAGVLASTSICFDLSVFEIFVPICCGGKIVLAENALALPSLPARDEVSLINTVPSAMTELLRAKAVPRSVRVINLAGEPLSTTLVDRIYQETSVSKVYDLYGPTETTTYSTGALRRPGAPATIGRPLANEAVYLLDPYQQPVPIGVPGELHIGGAGLARGYLGQPELTAQKFVPHPFRPGERLYRTGDLARWTADGNLQFLGRLDHQVKIRGFRIELGEIETLLRAQPGVKEAVVLAREDQPGDKRLVAYVAAGGEPPHSPEELRQKLGAKLPSHMIPSAFVLLESLPLTPNGKVDRKRLPMPGQDKQRSQREPVAPRGPIEEQMARIWTEVLHVEKPSVHDNFFDLGGHSLLAAQVVSRIREQFKIDVPLVALFTAPTISALAEGVSSGQWSSGRGPVWPLRRVPRDRSHPVSFVQERLWFLDQLRPGSDAYNVPAALRLKGELDTDALGRALNSMLDRHEALRSVLEYANGELLQVIHPRLELNLQVQELARTSAASEESKLQTWLSSEARRSFDLAAGPLLRPSLLRLGPADHVLLVVMHHTICDGWSLALFFQELETFYRAAAAGQPVPRLPDLPVQYVDFAHWQRQSMHGPVLERELAYWKNKLAGAPPAVDLPGDHQGSDHFAATAARRAVIIEKQIAQAMADLGQQESLTPFMVLMSALTLTLHKWTSQKDLVIGTVVAGRNRRETESVVGCFMNFVPLRTRIWGTETGYEILSKVRTSVLEGQNHQECPFEKIVEVVNPERRGTQNPLYNVAFLLQNFPAQLFPSPTLEVSQISVSPDAALLDLRFEAEQTPAGLSLVCEYRTDLFEAGTIEKLLGSVLQILSRLVRAPQSRLDEFTLAEALEAQAKAARGQMHRRCIATAATFTAEPLTEPLHFWLKELHLPATLEFAPYSQVFQQLLDPASLLFRNTRGLNLILLRFEDWRGQTDGSSRLSQAEAIQNIERSLDEFVASLRAASGRSAVPWLVCVCPGSGRVDLGPEADQRFERLLVQNLHGVAGVHLLTTSDLARWYPVADWLDTTSDELAHVPYTPLFFTALATAVVRAFHALNRSPHKVIVLDCDQTLWSGVCGE